MTDFKIPKEPHFMNEYFAEAYNSGNVDRLNSLFEPTAKILNRNGEIIFGQENMNKEHLGLLKLGGRMVSKNILCVQNENIALLRANWEIETLDENSEKIIIKGSSSEIVRKQPNGTWLYIVDAPFGASI